MTVPSRHHRPSPKFWGLSRKVKWSWFDWILTGFFWIKCPVFKSNSLNVALKVKTFSLFIFVCGKILQVQIKLWHSYPSMNISLQSLFSASSGVVHTSKTHDSAPHYSLTSPQLFHEKQKLSEIRIGEATAARTPKLNFVYFHPICLVCTVFCYFFTTFQMLWILLTQPCHT